MLRSDRRKRQRELQSTISAGRLFHTFTMRQAKKWYLIFVFAITDGYRTMMRAEQAEFFFGL